MSEDRAVMHVLSHTHWDREWYQDFQGFRQRLVFQVDQLLDLLEQRPEYRHFHMDGQTSCLLDYLEIRPEQRERLTKHIRDGRIIIGPWFVMPDELLLSGESMVRNLLLGYKLCDEFGADPMPIGYVTDIFGHCTQFPQILRGFGIDAAILQRGTGGEDGVTEMVWEGADGTTVLLVKCFPYGSYGDLFCQYSASDEDLKTYEQRKLSLATTDVLFAMDGSDHAPANWKLPEFLEKLNGIFEKTECVHSSMPAFLVDLKQALGPGWEQSHKRLTGELRVTNKQIIWGEVFQGTGSSRVYLKQANDSLEYLLPRCAEPLHAWSVLAGGDDQKAFLNLAWRYFLTNHPHDSMVGCSVDKVHSDMMYRFAEADSLAWNSIYESIQTIGDRINTSALGEGRAVTLFNQATVDADPTARFSFEIPQGDANEKRGQGLTPVLFDADGQPISIAIESSEPGVTNLPVAKKFRGDSPKFWILDDAGEYERFHAVGAASVPAMGYRSWRLGYLPREEAAHVSLPEGLRPVSSSAQGIENEFVSLTARPDGLVDLLDKATGTWYRGLHALEDRGDVGTGWDHIYPRNDTTVLSTDEGARGPVSIEAKQSGSLTASLTVSYSMNVPAALSADRASRASGLVPIAMETVYTLDAGSHRIDCRTTIDNKAKNHRMRVILPTGRRCDTWFCDTAFDLVERDVRLPDTTDYQEKKREESPIKNLVAACDGTAGLAVITKGLQEACVQDNEGRSIALTLFRGFSQSIGGHWTTDSQMLGEVVLEYALVPFIPENAQPPVGILREVERFKMPLVSLTSPIHDGDLPTEARPIELSGDAVLSTMKTAEDGNGLIVRLFNPYTHDTQADLTLATAITSASLCDMTEAPQSDLQVTDGERISVRIPAKKVATVRVGTK